jgi:hypothetical protein
MKAHSISALTLAATLLLGGCAFSGCILTGGVRICGAPMMQSAPVVQVQQVQQVCNGQLIRYPNGAIECRAVVYGTQCYQNPLPSVNGGWRSNGMWCTSALEPSKSDPSFEVLSKVAVAPVLWLSEGAE